MRYLGVDYGAARVGFALSDPDGRIAFPHDVVLRPKAIAAIRTLLRREGVGRIVVGLPRSLSGGVTPQTRSVEAFIRELQKVVRIPVVVADERFTTRMAMGPKGKTDASAAALILQAYLDRTTTPKP